MATDVKNANEDADMAECEGEKVVTMMDVLKEQEDFEDDANAVLGGSDDKNCTYSKGYIKRQAIYACLTCCSEAKTDPDKRAGVCLACSLMCHESHELIELYTKRNFKCDCGNPKFNSHPCTFTPNKTELNEDNKYNQNFSGLYCTCQRPYPDPEATEDEVMIQCIICEDWLHSSHLESNVPANDQYSEMVCKQCMEKNEFLHDYSEFAVNTECTIEIVQVNGNDGRNVLCNGDASKVEAMDSTNDNDVSNVDIESMETKQDVTSLEDNLAKAIVEESDKKANEKKHELNTCDSESVKDNSLNKDSENIQDSLEDAKNIDPKLHESQQKVETNETVSVSGDAESSKISEDVTAEEDKEKSDIDTASANVKEDNVSIESETHKSTQITVPSDGKSNESDEKEPEHISKVEDSKTTDISDEEKHKKEQDAEKTEEDRLLADPVEEPEPISNNLNTKDVSNTETIPKEEENSPESNKETNTSEKKNEHNTDESNDKVKTTESDVAKPEAISDMNKNVQENSTNKEESPLKQDKSLEKRKLSTEDSVDNLEVKKAKLTHNKSCSRPQGVKKVYNGATFWPSSFRQKLCTCEECLSMYRDLSVLFLTDPEDTVTAYENLGKDTINGKPLTQYEKGLEALSSLDRIQQINALTEYNKMRDKLLDFLKSFKDRKEIVKEEDIKAFFAGMKPKREPDGVYFCREV